MSNNSASNLLPLSATPNLAEYVRGWILNQESCNEPQTPSVSVLKDEEKHYEALTYEPQPPSDFLELSAASKISLHVRNKQLDHEFSDDPREKWRSAPEIPLAQELIAPIPIKPLANRLDIPPASKVEYLGIHHRLYRYEATEPLRDAVFDFRRANYINEGKKAFIYTEVRAKGYLLSKQGACCRITFSTERSPQPIDWRVSDRLTPGALVVLSPSYDSFRRICIVATVASRSFNGKQEPDIMAGDDPMAHPQVELFWANPNEAIIEPREQFVMLESKVGYFENVRYTMLGLQHAALYHTTLDRYVLGCPSAVRSARHLAGTPYSIAAADDFAKQFDDSQREAFNAMTSREFSIVQGPPGTGKTFTSIAAIQSYVKTLRKCEKSRPAPIIIAAQTNHALDQLLELCLDHNAGKILRLGGQSRSDAVRQHSLFNLRANSKFRKPDINGHMAWKQISAAVERWFDVYSQDTICAEELRDASCITGEQYQSLLDGDKSWDLNDERRHEDDEPRSILSWLDIGAYDVTAIRSMLPVDEMEEIPPEKYDDTAEWDTEEETHAQGGRMPDDAIFKLRGLYMPITPKHTVAPVPYGRQMGGNWASESKKLLEKYSDLYKIGSWDRHMVYYYLKTLIRKHAIITIRHLLHEYGKVCESLKVNRAANSLQLIQYEGIEIVGCTTTGLAKYRCLLAAMMPRIMLIEEAAETREANIAAAMFPSLEQLVLVGDHQQLTPHVDIQHLGDEPYNLNVSMFERLVKLGLPYNTLQVQRRMIPQLREVVQTFYPMLKDHPIVMDPKNRPPVPGMGSTTLWWFQHKWPESRSETFSCSNEMEAQMIMNFVKYLVASGLNPSQVTVLTYYNAQLDLIKKLLREDAMLARATGNWSVRTVDGFQGEENDVILLSLVRSPDLSLGRLAAAGFVEDENRAVVATSRAKRGMYVFGNARNILESSHRSNETWQKVFNAFGTQTGNYLPVTCATHGDVIAIRTVEGWANISTDGCNKPCNRTCPNGHACQSQCHATDKEHRVSCQQACMKTLACGHACIMMCRDECRCLFECARASRGDMPARNPPGHPHPHPQRAERIPLKSPPYRQYLEQAPARSPYRPQAERTPAKSPHIQRLEQQQKRAARLQQLLHDSNEAEGSSKPVVVKAWTDVTSDEMMKIGYRNFVTKDSHHPVTTPRNIQRQPQPLPQQAHQTLADKWSPTTIKQREDAIIAVQREAARNPNRNAFSAILPATDDVFRILDTNAPKMEKAVVEEEDLIDFGEDA
ncbi:P-loop containing nucleoside triphosphate hydrolase protein [Trichoderma ceciliae]